MKQLIYEAPARFWEEALPLGNGRIGAMLYGGVEQERINLNEDTLWSGRPSHETGYQVAERIDEVRELIRAGRYADATLLTNEMIGLHDSQTYQMAGSLYIDFGAGESCSDYARTLELGDAISTVRFEQAGVIHRRESFVSAPHQVLAMRLCAGKKGALSFGLGMDSLMRFECQAEANALVMRGQCPLVNYSRTVDQIVWEEDGQGGMKFLVKVQLINRGGRVSAAAGRLSVIDADEVLLLVAIETGFVAFDQAPSDDVAAMERGCDRLLASAVQVGWEGLKAAHGEEYRSRYNRVVLDLGATDTRPTDVILKSDSEPEQNTALVNLVFNYGRYLLISCSRPGTQPANLQGIWNNKLVAPWRSNYTTNINTEMNYWSAESCNLADCAEPLIRFVRELAVSGVRPARELYGARGWCLHHNSDLWRYSYTGGDLAQHAFWPVGGAWVCQHLWEHFAFSGDLEFLAQALPLMTGAAAFLLDFMVTNEAGALVTSPSTSPENQFLEPGSGEPASVCEGSAMDLTMIRELFESLLEGSRLLGTTGDWVDEVRSALDRLPLPVVGKDGRLLEFGIEADEPEPGHRHVSHLYGVYPGWLFTPHQHSDLFEACRRSLEARGDRSTGWAMGWRVALWARFGDGNRALRVIGDLLSYVDADRSLNYSDGGGLYANLWDAHPPFQIDGNFGVTAGIAEMLLQSHRRDGEWRVIDLLPALPGAWPCGRVRGLRARGGLTVDMAWENGAVTAVTLHATLAITLFLRRGDAVETLTLSAGDVRMLRYGDTT
ncbi:MAG: glycoside hydrolase family 95 protein [Lentisphaerae bacterium]|nr:glycoside hydrolase family 95 protein [Lentisphaerota bacterium]